MRQPPRSLRRVLLPVLMLAVVTPFVVWPGSREHSMRWLITAWSLSTRTEGRIVPLVTTEMGSVSQVVVATGRVEPVVEIALANKIPGRIRSIFAKEGESVTRGQPLIAFDDEEPVAQQRLARAKIANAEAELVRARRALEAARARWEEAKSGARPQEIERARAELNEARQKAVYDNQQRERYRRLAAHGYVARSEYDSATTAAEMSEARVKMAEETLDLLREGPKPETVRSAWAQVKEAEAELQRAETQVVQAHAELKNADVSLKTTVIESTVDGKVIRKLVEPGEAVDIGMPLMVVGDVSKVIVKAEVDETDVAKLALGQSVEILSDAYPGQVFRGRLIEIGQAVGKRKIRSDDPSRIQDMKVLETKVEVTEGGERLKLGVTVDVKIRGGREGVAVIPASVVPPGSHEALVRVVGSSGTEMRQITLGARDGEKVEVVSGLRIGEQFAVPGR
jgi:ABC exporter DevB family membrane fusion protein